MTVVYSNHWKIEKLLEEARGLTPGTYTEAQILQRAGMVDWPRQPANITRPARWAHNAGPKTFTFT